MESDGQAEEKQAGDAEQAPAQGHAPEDPAQDSRDEARPGKSKKSDQPSKFDKELKTTDLIIAVSGGVSALAAIISASAAYYAASQIKGTSDQTDTAINRMADVAGAIHGEADALGHQVNALSAQDNIMANEFGEMRTQTNELGVEASAAQGQLKAARSQTAAISQQTEAIKSSSSAAVRNAEAQITSAMAQTEAARAEAASRRVRITLSDVVIIGLNSAPDKSDRVNFTVRPTFLVSGSGSATIQTIFFHTFFGETLPDTPPKDFWTPIGGNDVTYVPGATFGPVEALKFSTTKDQAAKIQFNNVHVFTFGEINFLDAVGFSHRTCFADMVTLNTTGAPNYLFVVDKPKYRCANS